MSAAAEHRLESIRPLHREWAAFVLFCLAFLALGAFALSAQWPVGAVLRWALLAGAVMLYMQLVLLRNLHANRRPGDSALLPNLGWGNRLTLLRGTLLAALVGFAGGPAPIGWLAWAPGVIYSLAVAADALDGFVARRTNHATRLGEILDMSLDGLGVLGAALLIVLYGRAPGWFILVGLARYLFLAGAWLRQQYSRPVHPLPPSTRRRMYASIQMVFLAVMLFPLFPPPLTAVAAAVFAIFFLASFTWDWLLVSGVVPRAPAAWTNRSRSGLPALQVALRIGLLTLAVIFTLQSLENSSPAVIALSLLQLLAAGLVFLGIASRISSGVALILIGLGQMLASPGDLQVIQVIAYSTIIFIGSGPYSLWLLEESWFERPAHQPGQAEMNRSQRETLPQTASKA
jgi:CDP-diacylglycerol--glycerol-3-phosphate 3-phosphatidyltransferase